MLAREMRGKGLKSPVCFSVFFLAPAPTVRHGQVSAHDGGVVTLLEGVEGC